MTKVVSYYRNHLINPAAPYEDNGTQNIDYPHYTSTQDMVDDMMPALPVYTLQPTHIQSTATEFVRSFPGTTMFAVKTNPHPVAIAHLYKGGVHSFDVASIEEMRMVRDVAPKSELFFMHTIKSSESIHEAYFEHNVRNFALDHEEELAKILRVTNNADDLNLFVRVALPKNANASIDLSAKFGAAPDLAVDILRACRKVSVKLGVAFHVGTQISDAACYANAIHIVRGIIDNADVRIDCLDIGGGFPVPYEGENVPSVHTCIDVVRTSLRIEGLDEIELFAEPGRALVAQGGVLIVRVEARRGDRLYINDGTYGGLFDAGKWLNTRFPVKAMRMHDTFEGALRPYSLAGPTCDSLDMMEGPFMLPSDIRTGDWIEIRNTGAYSQSIRTNFNGFGASKTVLISPRM